MRNIFIALVILLASFTPISAQRYMNQVESLRLNNTPPLDNFVPFRWQAYAYQGKPWTTLRWHSEDNSWNSYITTARSNWTVGNYWPDWLDIELYESPLPSSQTDIVFKIGDCANPIFTACSYPLSYVYHNTRNVWSIDQWAIQVTDWENRSSAFRRETLGHELGHIFGLYHPDGDSCGSTSSIMQPNHSCGARASQPSSYDYESVWRFYTACDGASYWCGRMQMSGSPAWSGNTLISIWKTRAWMVKTARLYYYKAPNAWGPWTQIDYEFVSDDVGYWEDAIPQTNGYYTIYPVKNLGSQVSSGQWVEICARPWITFSHYGFETCSGPIQKP